MNTASKCIYSLMMLQLPMLQCCRLPMLHAPNNAAGCQHVKIPHCKLFASEAPNCYAAGCLCCRLPTMLQCCNLSALCCNAARSQHVAIPHCKLFRARLPTAMLQAAYTAVMQSLSSLLQALTSMLQCCTLLTTMLQAANTWRLWRRSGLKSGGGRIHGSA
jgi:hypothetical protein